MTKSKSTKRASFEAEISRLLPELYGAAVKLTRNGHRADDLLQEAVMRAYIYWDRFQEGTNARAWMHRILYNTFVNGYRKTKRESELFRRAHTENQTLGRTTASGPTVESLSDEVEAALDQLSDEFRETVLLVDLSGLSYKEAADAMGCPVGTVMSRLHRARASLKSALGGYAVEEGYVSRAA